MRKYIRITAILLCAIMSVLGLDRTGAFQPLEKLFLEMRMATESRPASGKVVFVAIDDRSIRELETWPWPREIHADLLDRLLALGATEVFFDVDFSTPSTPASDGRLADALDRAGGMAILPAFKQQSGPERHSLPPVPTFPMRMFRRHSWLAAVNVEHDTKGRVWTYPWGQVIGEEHLGSAGAVIAGRSGPPGQSFFINYGIDPTSVPRYSVSDIMGDRVPHHRIDGRSVVVGADAAGLRDNITVPVYGVIPGALLHILAAETLIANNAPTPLKSGATFSLVAGLAVLLALSPLGRRPLILGAAFGLTSLVLELIAILLHVYAAAVLITPALHAVLVGTTVVMAIRELDLRRWLAHQFRVDAKNTTHLFNHVISTSSDAILVVNERGGILEMNGRAQALFAMRGDSPRSIKYADFLPHELSAAIDDAMESLRLGHAMPKKAVSLYHFQEKQLYLECSVSSSHLQYRGRNFELAEPDIIAFAMIRDVTDAHNQRAQLNYLVQNDALTGICNRYGLLRVVEEILHGDNCDVLVIDIHRFKAVNGTLGRTIGDAVLRTVAARLEGVAPDPPCVARLSGGTFAVAYPSVMIESPRSVADDILGSMAALFEIEGVKVVVRAHVGMTRVGIGGDAKLAIEQAETAVDIARQPNGNNPSYYEGSMVARQMRARHIDRSLWQAITDRQLHLVYQPQVSPEDLRVIGAEALIRWRHPELGHVDPNEFIPIAESNGFIDMLGQWVLETACADASQWPCAIPVSVNISPSQLTSENLPKSVRKALSKSGLRPERLSLEITERALGESTPDGNEALAAVRQLGVSLVLEDFAGGVSSMGYLATRLFKGVKLDQMLVRGSIDESMADAMIAGATTLCAEWGVELLCEGVETIVQKERLTKLGCEQAQGFHFGKPMELPAFLDWVREHDGRGGLSKAGSESQSSAGGTEYGPSQNGPQFVVV